MRLLSILAVAAVIGLAPQVALAAISPGTRLVGTMDTSLNSKDAQVGQTFTMSDVHSADNNITGAVVYGHVASVQRASQGTPGKIQLAVDKMRTRAGNIYSLGGSVVGATTNTKNNTLKEAGGAVAGMIVGNIVGKKLGTNLGGLVGAAGGYLYAKNSKENVSVPQNAAVTIEVRNARPQARIH